MSDPRLALFDAGYTDLVSVAPPGAQLSAGSSLDPADLGKRPAVKGTAGWYGYAWLTAEPTRDNVEQYVDWDANVGLLGTHFPAIDIDCSDETLATIVRNKAESILGLAPVREGRSPRSLLVYRSKDALSRIQLEIDYGDERQLVELLGHGRQYLVYGQHPTAGAYKWITAPLWEILPSSLNTISADDVMNFFNALVEDLATVGVKARIIGTGATMLAADIPEQENLLAPSIEVLREIMAVTPNDREFPDREDYIRMGCAIKAAAGDDEMAGLEIFLEWASRWEVEGGNDPDVVRADWRRMHPPFRVGWNAISQYAPGIAVAQQEFEADPKATPPPIASSPYSPNLYTDDWLSEQILPEVAKRMRYDHSNQRWHIWDDVAWSEDTGGKAGEEILFSLRRLSKELSKRAASVSEGEGKAIGKAQGRIGEYPTQTRVTNMLEMRSGVRCDVDTFDQKAMELNTPGGIVDLSTGQIRPSDPDAMHSRVTYAAPAPAGGPAAAPLWHAFLDDVTQNDDDLRRYLQKLAGYCLTGTVREHALTFVWGPGGNGKSVWLNTVAKIMASYATPAPLTAFFRTSGDSHPTDLAGLMGARLVTAPETQAGRVWDDQKIKAVTSGDPIRARFMRADFVEFTPRFKLIVVGNHAPQMAQVDDAMRRRLNIVPFTFKPMKPDTELMEKLEAEYPAILRWMIDGCLLWSKEGLEPPEVVREKTDIYFKEENTVRAWMDECCDTGQDQRVSRQDMYGSWKAWCDRNGEFAGSARNFKAALQPLLDGLPIRDRKVGEADARVAGYWGIGLKNQGEF